jgi:hypothetical protein
MTGCSYAVLMGDLRSRHSAAAVEHAAVGIWYPQMKRHTPSTAPKLPRAKVWDLQAKARQAANADQQHRSLVDKVRASVEASRAKVEGLKPTPAAGKRPRARRDPQGMADIPASEPPSE